MDGRKESLNLVSTPLFLFLFCFASYVMKFDPSCLFSLPGLSEARIRVLQDGRGSAPGSQGGLWEDTFLGYRMQNFSGRKSNGSDKAAALHICPWSLRILAVCISPCWSLRLIPDCGPVLGSPVLEQGCTVCGGGWGGH